ncbi:MAG: hypothetical protein NT061_00755 [Spirochaetes bacterium]|nr:hypothetical protein [Spirochaetota bacterium]
MSADINESLVKLLKSISLQEIKPITFHSDTLGQMPVAGSQLQLAWNQSLAEGDPVSASEDTKVFRPKYNFNVSFQDTIIFTQESVFVLVFHVNDQATFDELWADEELRKVFVEKQLLKTMWPLFRQHVQDGMCRLGMSPVALPWLL